MTRVAAIDCGTNSIRLLVADLDGRQGSLTDVERRMEVVRLGQGVDRSGRLAPEALERTFTACRHYAELVRELGAERLRFVATSATRDAANRDEFVRGVRDVLGVDPEVVSGDEEAALSFAGATRELPAAGLPGPYLVVDIGGGSTEFVLGDASGVRAARSVDIGCVRMTERHLHDDPPTAAQVAAARAEIDAAIELAAAVVPLGEARTLVGVAGSVTTVTAMVLGLAAYDPAAIHLARVGAEDVREATSRLLAMPREERAALPFMHPGRVDVIGAGALVLVAVLDRVGPDRVGLDALVTSEHDILDGIALSML
ncbi:MAG: Ppx/GppA family phosphatase [Actinomycetota bacterium]|nr:Ppx/GppA family phosphatase [Actinomycetota bacterium]